VPWGDSITPAAGGIGQLVLALPSLLLLKTSHCFLKQHTA